MKEEREREYESQELERKEFEEERNRKYKKIRKERKRYEWGRKSTSEKSISLTLQALQILSVVGLILAIYI